MTSTQPVQVTASELEKHNTKEDCWIAVHSKVWDLTEFIDEHPGGPDSEWLIINHSTHRQTGTNTRHLVLVRYAGRNATEPFDKVHAPGILEDNLSQDKYKGMLEEPSVDVPQADSITEVREIEAENGDNPSDIPQLHAIISAADLEKVAERVLSAKTWAFYSSAATDLITHRQNKALLRRMMIQPRILRDVQHVDFRRAILGCQSSAPFFISPAAMARLAHPDGELALARAAGEEGIIQCVMLPCLFLLRNMSSVCVHLLITLQVSNNASFPLPKIVEAGKPSQPFFFQLYVNRERHKTTELLQKARDLGIKAIFVTVDAPVPGKREADERIAAGQVQSAISGATATNDKKGGGLGRLMGQYIDKALTWSDLAWIKQTSSVPIVLKGVQSVEDAKLAVQYGVDGIFLSNHGGRSLDT